MSRSSLSLSARSYLIAGVSAAVVGAAVVTPASVPALSQAKVSAALSLTSITTPLEDGIKNVYNAVEPWAAYGAELAQWGLSFIPGLWWIAPGIDLAYFSIEPLVQAGVFTFADIVGLDFAQIGPDIRTGISEAGNNFVTYGLAWLSSLVPFPPFPPFPPGPFAASAQNALSAAAADVVAGPKANSITTPIENAIKNTYNWAEGWTNYAMQWADYVLGLIPVVNWFAPAVPLVYNTIEPLVRGGVYAFADLIGLNFAAIGPDVWNGIRTSFNNAIAGVLNWINIPLPPRPPIRSAAAHAGAASLRAAAVVTPDVTEKVVDTVAEAPEAPKAPEAPEAATPGTEKDAQKAESAAQAPAEVTAPESTPAADHAAPGSDAPEAPAATETPSSATESAQPTRPAHRAHSAAASERGSVKAERPSRPARSDRG